MRPPDCSCVLLATGGGSKGFGIIATLLPVEPFSPINPFSPVKPPSPMRPELLDEEEETELEETLDCVLVEELAETAVSVDTDNVGVEADGDSTALALGDVVGAGTGTMGVNRFVGNIGLEEDVDVDVPLGVALEEGVNELSKTTASCALRVEVESPDGLAGVVLRLEGDGSVTPLESAVVLF
jgi:hypothetical protein